MKILVTGCAGFIGSHLVDALLEAGHIVVGIDNLVAGYVRNLDSAVAHYSRRFTFVKDDIRGMNSGCYNSQGFDAIFHLAASKKTVSLNDPFLDLHVNACGTLELLEYALRFKIKHFIHFSTGSVYGNSPIMSEDNTGYNPVSHYGVSKLAGERYAMLYHKLYGLPVTVLRPFHVYGQRQESADARGGVIAIWCRRIANHKPITIFGDGQQTRTFTYVKDVVDAAVMALERPEMAGQVYNISSGEIVQLHDILDILKPETVLYEAETVGDIRDFTGVRNDKIKALGLDFETYRDMLPQVMEWYKNET